LSNTPNMPATIQPMTAQLVQPQQQPTLVPTMPYPQYYSQFIYPTLLPSNEQYQQQLTGGALKRSAVDKNGVPSAVPIYAQAAPMNPYLMQVPGYAPVSFSGQLPPRY
jgi:hypothetical protein